MISFLEKNKIPFSELVSLSSCTSFQTGGVAELLIQPRNEQQVSELMRFCKENGKKWFVLGKGSNLLAPDGLTKRPLIRLAEDELLPIQLEKTVVRCGAGIPLMKLCRFAQSRGLSGLEFAYGIPGSVGGAVFMNAGAYGGEIKDRLLSVRVVWPDGRAESLPAEKLALSYRTSRFQKEDGVICEATFRLEPGDGAEIEAKMKELYQRRRDKQPLEYPSAGSTFRRPAGYFAGALIEECGLKGLRVGGAQVSEKHAGFCINRDQATTSDVLQLIERIKTAVYQQKGVSLEPEVRLIPRN